jgi:hypothetical protein
MQTILLRSDSDENLKLIIDLAKKIGVSFQKLSDEEIEEIGLLNAMKKGRTKQIVDTNDFLTALKK